MTIGLIGRKAGMTRVFTDAGESIPVTVIEALPNRVTQVKGVEGDGYRAVQVTYGARKRLAAVASRWPGTTPRPRWPPASRWSSSASPTAKARTSPPGAELKVDMFAAGQVVDVTGTTIGKGFAGTIKRHNFARRPGHARRLAVPPRPGLDRPAPDAGPRVPGQAHVRPHGRHPSHHRESAGRRGRRRAQPAADPRRRARRARAAR